MNNKYLRHPAFGFTLIELMVVVAIIGILAAISLPAYQDYVLRAKMVEALTLPEMVRKKTLDYYEYHGSFPKNNKSAGVPPADKLIGNFVKTITVENGAIHVQLGNKINAELKGKTITFRPIVVIGSPDSPVSWVCGYDSAPEGMKTVGNNKTDVDTRYLPAACRG